ncbi:Uncharacterised protein [Mycobacteroides abscessus subsp. abscessus]|nr:Uncharacterised protein [Mycobacteroides abscessus subsp. abscessus]
MKNYSIARLNKVAEIGKTVSRRTGAGINISTFEPTGTLFYGSYNRTVTQSIAYDDDPNAFDVVTLKKTTKGA